MSRINIETSRPFMVGERVWDDTEKKWCCIVDIPGKCTAGKEFLRNNDPVILTDGSGEWICSAGNVYKIAARVRFRGRPVCFEHMSPLNGQTYYCPDLNEICYANEITRSFS